MNNAVFGKTMKNVRKNRDNNIATKESYSLVSESNYHTTKFFIIFHSFSSVSNRNENK